MSLSIVPEHTAVYALLLYETGTDAVLESTFPGILYISHTEPRQTQGDTV